MSRWDIAFLLHHTGGQLHAANSNARQMLGFHLKTRARAVSTSSPCVPTPPSEGDEEVNLHSRAASACSPPLRKQMEVGTAIPCSSKRQCSPTLAYSPHKSSLSLFRAAPSLHSSFLPLLFSSIWCHFKDSQTREVM